MISENAKPKNLHVERNPQCNCEKQEYQVFHSIMISELQHQHNQCKCWSITKQRHFQANVKHLTLYLLVWLYTCEVKAHSKFLQIFKFIQITRAIIFSENAEHIGACVYVFQKREKNRMHVCSLKVKVVKWTQNFEIF